jgi:hypothetical protein
MIVDIFIFMNSAVDNFKVKLMTLQTRRLIFRIKLF